MGLIHVNVVPSINDMDLKNKENFSLTLQCNYGYFTEFEVSYVKKYMYNASLFYINFGLKEREKIRILYCDDKWTQRLYFWSQSCAFGTCL